MKTNTLEIYLENINRAISFIEDNFKNDIVLQDIASQANLSSYHFHRIFKAITGETTKTFLTRIRLEKIALALKYTQDDIGMIALNNGYQNHETFSRAFKNYFGLTPYDYRKTIVQQSLQKQIGLKIKYNDISDLNIEKPIIKTIPDLHLAYIRHRGSYKNVGASFQQLMLWASTHLVLKLKPTTIGILHDNPDITAIEDMRFDACVITTKEIKPKGEIGYKKITGGKFAIFTYKGAYDGFYPVYDYIYNVCLFDYKFELAEKPAMEWYVKSPPFYLPQNYVTDFYVPIK